jgi:hypothetical protein
MNKWTDTTARQKAVEAFVKYLFEPGNEADRKKATDPKERLFAKELFARLGGFEIEGSTTDEVKIPSKMEFRVYEDNPTQQRDADVGIMVLPDKLETPVDVGQVWRCSWDDWTSLHVQTPQTKPS